MQIFKHVIIELQSIKLGRVMGVRRLGLKGEP
jgi:hypothetical protein